LQNLKPIPIFKTVNIQYLNDMLIPKSVAAILVLLCIAGCQKQEDTNHPPPPPVSNVKTPDSIFLLTSILGGSQVNGQDFNFEYDSLNNLTKFYRPYSWGVTSPCYVMYKNGKINYIISEYRDANGFILKSSMVFVYGSNNKCVKFYYKKPKYLFTPMDNNSSFFTDLSDDHVASDYDSLIYSSNQRLEKIHRFQNSISKPYSIIQLYYGDNSDTTLNKIEEYQFDNNGNQFLQDQLLITTDSIRSPVKNVLWYFPFVNKLSTIADNSENAMSLPILLDGPSTYLGDYLSLSAKCIKNYKVYNSWGQYNYTGTVFNYQYSADSLSFVGKVPNNPSLLVKYFFKKVPKK
jgi:hypothetical protein